MCKSFGSTKALDGASLAIHPGEVHALLGGNGSGKSTLIKALAGVQPAEGELFVAGHSYPLQSFTPGQAAQCGLRFVHQQPSTFSGMSVAENLSIGRGFERHPWGGIAWSRVNARVVEVLHRFRVNARPETPVGRLSSVVRTKLEIARVLQDTGSFDQAILVLDEATALLPGSEALHLLDELGELARDGQAIVLVTHRLPEVLHVADRATVLRDGRVAGVRLREELDHDTLIELIAGAPVDQVFAAGEPSERGRPAVEVSNLRTSQLGPLSLTVHDGEIVGLAGVADAGASQLVRVLAARQRTGSDQIRIHDPDAVEAPAKPSPETSGYFVPGDRAESGLPLMSLAENLTLTRLGRTKRLSPIRRRAGRRHVEALIRRFRIKATSPAQTFGGLSGGNQQKAILARIMGESPRLLLLDEPTYGVDVGARAEIYQHLREAARSGTAVLVASSDFEELSGLCDRVLVMVDGRIRHEVHGTALTPERLHQLTNDTRGNHVA